MEGWRQRARKQGARRLGVWALMLGSVVTLGADTGQWFSPALLMAPGPGFRGIPAGSFHALPRGLAAGSEPLSGRADRGQRSVVPGSPAPATPRSDALSPRPQAPGAPPPTIPRARDVLVAPGDRPGQGQSRVCPATFYGDPGDHVNAHTSTGERFDGNALTAAHRTLPAGNSPNDPRSTWLKVVNLANGKSVRVRVNDYGPSVVVGRTVQVCLDLSYAAFRQIADPELGRITVRFTVERLGTGGYRHPTGE